MKNKPRALILFGPTAVGKTELLAGLLPEKIEIISADSMQAYRGMDIGTAKPGPQLLARLPHHLLDIKHPTEQYTAGEFARLAEGLIRDIELRGRLPVVSGGTAFYLRELVFGLPGTPPSDPVLRRALDLRIEAEGLPAMYEELRRVDPAAAGRISPRDRYRIHRALEVRSQTGRPLSSFAVPDRPRDDLELLLVGLRREREELYRRIDERVEAMFERGLPAEVAGLAAAGLEPEDPGMRAIGYREFFAMRAGCLGLEQVKLLIQRDTRRFAKRQITFFSGLPEVHWLPAGDGEALAGLLKEFFGIAEL